MAAKARRARNGETSPRHPLKAALEAVLAGKSRFVELRDPTHPAGFTEFERAFLERWRDDCNANNAKHWDRLAVGMKRRGNIQQAFERFLDVVHSSLAVAYALADMRKRVQALLGEKLNRAKELDELAAKAEAEISAFTELFKSFGDEFPPKTLLGLHEGVHTFKQRAMNARREAALVDSWLPWVPGTRQSSSRARLGNVGGVREYVGRKAFMQALSYIMRSQFGQPNDPIVAAITTLAFPEDEATERDVRNAREAPAVTPLASRETIHAALISHVEHSVKVAEALDEAMNSRDFPHAEKLAEELAKAQASLDADTAFEVLQRLHAAAHAESLAKAVKSLDVEALGEVIAEVVRGLDAPTGEELLRLLERLYPERFAEVMNWVHSKYGDPNQGHRQTEAENHGDQIDGLFAIAQRMAQRIEHDTKSGDPNQRHR